MKENWSHHHRNNPTKSIEVSPQITTADITDRRRPTQIEYRDEVTNHTTGILKSLGRLCEKITPVGH